MFSRISKTIAIRNLVAFTPCRTKKTKQGQGCQKGRHDKPKKKCVAIVGASGKVGSMVALLLKQSPYVDTLLMCDMKNANCGVSMDLSHIDTKCRIKAYTGADQLGKGLSDADIVLVCAGNSRRPGMSTDDLFECNAETVKSIAKVFAECSPKAFLGIITQPINSLVPLVSEVLKAKKCYDPTRIYGISSVNVIRATTFVAEALAQDPSGVIVPVVGGHSEKTIVPILSQAKPCSKLTGQETCEIIRLVKKSANWVFEMKDRKQAAILSPAYAAARFTNNLLKAMDGQLGVFDCAYIHSKETPGVRYCTMPIELGVSGIKNAKLPKMCGHEARVFEDALRELAPEIKKGEDYILQDKSC